MMTTRKKVAALYVDRNTRQWVVLDPEGNFWSLPVLENPWDHRLPFEISEESDLEPIPKHYEYILGLSN